MKKHLLERRQPWAGVATAAALPGWGSMRASESELLGFAAVPVSSQGDMTSCRRVTVRRFSARGDPEGIAGAQPEFRFDGSNSAAEQELQAGMHHDAVELFPRFRRAKFSQSTTSTPTTACCTLTA